MRIDNFRDHPSLQFNQVVTVFLCGEKFYFADSEGLYLVDLLSMTYTNLGDPYRKLSRLAMTFVDQPDSDDLSMDLSLLDATRLVRLCRTRNYPLSVSTELMDLLDLEEDETEN